MGGCLYHISAADAAIGKLRLLTFDPGGAPVMASIHYSTSVGYGITFGNALAIAISWSKSQSVLWAIIDGFFSWLYVLYYLLFG
jgi:hypothetical protein